MRKNSSSTDYIAYALDESPENSAELPDGYYFKTWLPRILDPLPPTLGPKSIIWTVSHFCGVLGNRFFRIVFVCKGNRIVHRSCVFPAHFRWSFMKVNDLQIGATWTDPAQRCKGLASATLAHITSTMAEPGRRFWYISREQNAASRHACEYVGFKLVAHLERHSILEIPLTSWLVVTKGQPEETARGRTTALTNKYHWPSSSSYVARRNHQ
jgi:RimJ/RimL family protein N-acetyltransferase